MQSRLCSPPTVPINPESRSVFKSLMFVRDLLYDPDQLKYKYVATIEWLISIELVSCGCRFSFPMGKGQVENF